MTASGDAKAGASTFTLIAGAAAAVAGAVALTCSGTKDTKGTTTSLSSTKHENKAASVELLPASVQTLLKHPSFAPSLELISKSLNNDDITNDSLIKIVRQIDFWVNSENVPTEEVTKLTERLIKGASWRSMDSISTAAETETTTTTTTKFKCPKVRFGKTELQMPIITCGSMRFQHTWMPDNVPVVGSSQKKAIQTPSQDNVLNIVRECFKVGITHFETARYYGTSEIQLMTALAQLIELKEIERSDFILQTKLPPTKDGRKAFEKLFNESWDVFQTLGYIDLLSFWCVSSPLGVEWSLSEADDGCMAAALGWKKDGKIKHIGISSHGSASIVMQLIESNKFDYINLHYHYFGSYHAEGTSASEGSDNSNNKEQPDTHGNLACVKRALELDMGVFNISPIDKGGRVYQPSATVARTLGSHLSPISFVTLHGWMTAGVHTTSVGFARPEDLNEVIEAASFMLAQEEGEDTKQKLLDAESRLDALAKDKLGSEWCEKGMLNLPHIYEPSSDGIAIGHCLWVHNMVTAYGMYETGRFRYKNLLETGAKWSKKKNATYEENIKNMNTGNPGRAYDPSVDLTQALKHHYDPELVLQKLKECHGWFTNDNKGTLADKLSPDERKARGWDEAYDLRPWHEFPDMDRMTVKGVMLQNLTGGWLGIGGGPTTESKDYGALLRATLV
jgi:predicted aldo/keto reductase-like oxidoreductase